MKRAITVTALAAVLAFTLAGCGNSAASSASSPSSAAASSVSASPASSAAAVEKFDGSAFEDTGAGTMFLYTPGGTSENGNVPQVAIKKGTTLTQIDINYRDGDGSVCTVYVDGIENTKMNASQFIQSTFTLQGSDLDDGVHTVEMVAMDGDTPTIYKKAQYEIVS